MLAEIEVKTRQLLSDAISENTDLGYYRIQKLIKARSVKINGMRVGADMNVNAGDTVHVYFADREKNSIEVVYRDDNILVVNKASGIEVQGTDSITERINNLLTDVVAAPVHRLDRNTMGLVVFALTPAAAAALSRQSAERKMEKTYLAVRRVVDNSGVENRNCQNLCGKPLGNVEKKVEKVECDNFSPQ